MDVMLKKGAMFGLDARIALAIFGALSVISGAALYSAIQTAKNTAIVTQYEEIAKATIQYSLDTGVDLLGRSGADFELTTKHLFSTDGSSNWKGPYISGEATTDYHFNLVNGGPAYFIYRCDNAFGNDFSAPSCSSCTDKLNCGIWIKSNYLGGVSQVAQLDEMIDGSDGYDKGKFRVMWADAAPSDNLRTYYYIKPAF
jgi:type II secretory pathway pseudopilin PulG